MKTRKRRSCPTITHHGITLREIKPGKWQTDFFRDGKRDRRVHESQEAAKRVAEELAVKIRNEGSSILDLTQIQRRDALKALGILKGASTLTAAAQFWARHNAVADGVTVRELGERWLADLRRRGCRATTLREREHKVSRLSGDYGDRAACSITKDEITGWLDAWKLSGVTADGYRRCFNAMFNYGVDEKIIELNPVAAIKAFRSDERLPVPFKVQDVRSVMAAAEKHAPIMVPTLAVQFFAGLRPGEAKGLKWEDIDWKEKTIRVMPETSKMRRSRIVEMNRTLLDWLQPYRKASGPIGITSQNQFDFYMTRKRWAEGKETGILGASGVEWIQDGPRKTFASMHYATHGDAAKLAAILGHSGDAGILFKHYRGLVKKTEAARYWKLRPAKDAEKKSVIPFPKAVNQ